MNTRSDIDMLQNVVEILYDEMKEAEKQALIAKRKYKTAIYEWNKKCGQLRRWRNKATLGE